MSILIEKNIVKNEGVTSKLFDRLTPGQSFLENNFSTPQEYVNYYWNSYQTSINKSNSIDGHFFDLVVFTLLYREKILPFYTQAKVTLVPNIEFDIILYSKEKNSLSILNTKYTQKIQTSRFGSDSIKICT